MSLTGDMSKVFSKFTKFPVAIVSRGGDKAFLHITWLHDQWVTWLGGWDSLTLNHKGYSKSNELQIGEALFYQKLGQTLLWNGAASLLQIGASVVTNWGSYYKLGQPLLQNRAAITNWNKMYHKLRQVLKIRAIITN